MFESKTRRFDHSVRCVANNRRHRYVCRIHALLRWVACAFPTVERFQVGCCLLVPHLSLLMHLLPPSEWPTEASNEPQSRER